MTVAQFKQLVYNYTRFDDGAYTRGGVDALLDAVNVLRQDAARLHSFSFLRTKGYLALAADGKTAWATVKPNADLSGTSISLARLSSVFELNGDGDVTKRALVINDESFGTTELQGRCFSVDGQYLYHPSGWESAVVGVTGYKELADLTGAETDDMFINRYRDWLLMATVNYMNFYLNEQSRIRIIDKELQRKFKAMVEDDMRRAVSAVNV